MATKPKLSEKEIREIMASRARGESFTSIGDRLGYRHSMIIRGHNRGLAAQAAEMAEAAAEKEWHDSRQALWDGWTVDFSPQASGPMYPEPAYCVAYWQNKVNGAAPGAAYARARRNLYDVCHGTLLKIEEPAIEAGRPLYLYPNGYPPRSKV